MSTWFVGLYKDYKLRGTVYFDDYVKGHGRISGKNQTLEIFFGEISMEWLGF